MREYVARRYSVFPPERVEETMSFQQIGLRYYLDHKDETQRQIMQARYIGLALGMKFDG